MAEVVDFRVPSGSDQTLLVWGLEPEPGLEHSLFSAFSRFGPLYSVRAHRNAAVAGPGYCAVITFYSAGDASRAQRTCNGQRLFQKSPLKVCVCTKQKGFQHQVLALSSNKCQELANHYLGFNGWSSRIITVRALYIHPSSFPSLSFKSGQIWDEGTPEHPESYFCCQLLPNETYLLGLRTFSSFSSSSSSGAIQPQFIPSLTVLNKTVLNPAGYLQRCFWGQLQCSCCSSSIICTRVHSIICMCAHTCAVARGGP
ncbi:RAD52 motif-containing protein 1-like [Strigops habroptila]|uniref:RAD52 motif-containing protein 1-like n=1 Tax=Strigops habroptila TaxID=2489341 RepID=UPI0011D033C2|nr:RAD52 motif-containing protein 1-like [Strigops habroptila]